MEDAGSQKRAKAQQECAGSDETPEYRRERRGKMGEQAKQGGDDRGIHEAAPISIEGLGCSPRGASGKIGGERCSPLRMKTGPQKQYGENGSPQYGGGDGPKGF